MAVTITLVIFSVVAMIVFILAFFGALHIVLVRTVSFAITTYFTERKKFIDGITKDEIMLKMATNSDIKEA